MSRHINLQGVSQGPAALGDLDLETLGSSITDLLEGMSNPGMDLDIGDGRLLRQHADLQSMGPRGMMSQQPLQIALQNSGTRPPTTTPWGALQGWSIPVG